ARTSPTRRIPTRSSTPCATQRPQPIRHQLPDQRAAERAARGGVVPPGVQDARQECVPKAAAVGFVTRMRRVRFTSPALVLSLTFAAPLIAAPSARAAGTVLCDQFASTPIRNRYVVQNNRWGSTDTQCIRVLKTGFAIRQQDGVKPTNGAPNSYPS